MTESMLPSINTPDRQAEAFPVLTPAQIDRIRPYGTLRAVEAGEVLFEAGELGIPCFVVLSGKLNAVMTKLSGEHVFATHGPGNFSGDMVLISGTGSLARGRVAEPGEFLVVTVDALRSLIAKDAELSDIFMRAFIQRRLALIAGGIGNLIILGSRHSANTLRLREFLTVRRDKPTCCRGASPCRKGNSESILTSSLAWHIARCVAKRRSRHRWAG
jgi:thioredoxin reductase (NADPH)